MKSLSRAKQLTVEENAFNAMINPSIEIPLPFSDLWYDRFYNQRGTSQVRQKISSPVMSRFLN
jgi:hypothetical protein